MLSTEQGVIHGSDYYIYTPSSQATAMFLYPISTGYFRYLPGYCLRRSSYDSFLIMYMRKGSCEIESGGRTYHAKADQIVLLDCYKPHCYYTTTVLQQLQRTPFHQGGAAKQLYCKYPY